VPPSGITTAGAFVADGQVYIYLYFYIYIYIYIYMCTHIVYINIHTHMCTHICVAPPPVSPLLARASGRRSSLTDRCIYRYIYIQTHIGLTPSSLMDRYIFICIYIYIYSTHTHTHTADGQVYIYIHMYTHICVPPSGITTWRVRLVTSRR